MLELEIPEIREMLAAPAAAELVATVVAPAVMLGVNTIQTIIMATAMAAAVELPEEILEALITAAGAAAGLEALVATVVKVVMDTLVTRADITAEDQLLMVDGRSTAVVAMVLEPVDTPAAVVEVDLLMQGLQEVQETQAQQDLQTREMRVLLQHHPLHQTSQRHHKQVIR